MLNLIPLPRSVEEKPGTLPLTGLKIEAGGAGAQQVAARLQAAPNGSTVLRLTEKPHPLGPEGYTLTIHAGGIDLWGTAAGLARGAATLEQLLEQHPDALPLVEIEDAPRFDYRGMMLDVSRHFMPLEDIKRLIDELAALKFNTFHWHLTDDQGWRIEIERYPKLTEVGGWRARTLRGHASATPAEFDGVPHGGFYTQQQVRELVAYAAERQITVIPEIDLPGHAQAAQAAYPELSCKGQPMQVWDTWGINYEVYCNRESTFAFLEGVLEEVMNLFPSRTIHIGGDEVRTEHWAECPDCQAVMREQGLSEPRQLEAYFIGRIARFLTERGIKVIGWDEITEGELPAGVTVMSWRGFEGGIHAAKAGFDVIMSPQSHVYLDHYQGDRATEPLAIGGFSDLAKAYAFEPVPPELTAAEAAHILGGQANLWREYIPTTEHAHYMIFPRLHAVAEALWTRPEARDWNSFRQRLPAVLQGLKRRGVGFRELESV